jgi:KDO2-lipid IV(A) lauroyltransferase
MLRKGEHVGFIADQNAGDWGLFVPFLGRMASTYKSTGLLAMRYRMPIILSFARRIDEQFRYEVEFIDCITPADWADRDDPLFYVTARVNHAIERMIRLAPGQYLWVHRRWKSRPRKGRPPHAEPRR